MPVPIQDLTIDEHGIKATLSFRRVAHATVVPWSAVFAITDGDHRGFVWEADLPADLNLDAELAPEPSPSGPRAAGAPPTPIGSRSDADRAAPSKPAADFRRPGAPGAGKKPRPSHLKLVD
jgi:hypothetical protein